MIILTIRTDKPEAELGLYSAGQSGNDAQKQLAYETWEAHRQLADTIHLKIRALLQSVDKDWGDIQGIVGFQGPGSFTGLRIGLTVANTIAYAQHIPIVATNGNDWIMHGVNRLIYGENDTIALPEYGSEANITKPRK